MIEISFQTSKRKRSAALNKRARPRLNCTRVQHRNCRQPISGNDDFGPAPSCNRMACLMRPSGFLIQFDAKGYDLNPSWPFARSLARSAGAAEFAQARASAGRLIQNHKIQIRCVALGSARRRWTPRLDVLSPRQPRRFPNPLQMKDSNYDYRLPSRRRFQDN